MDWSGVGLNHNPDMVTLSQSKWSVRTLTVAVWALAAGSVLYWGLRLSNDRSVSATKATAVAPTTIDSLAVARLLGATAAQAPTLPSVASRFALQGVVAGTPGGGAALISVDGKPARPFRVGSAVEEGLILQSATARQVTFSASQGGPAVLTIDMPLLKP